VTRRSASEWAALFAAFVVAGAVVAFGVAVICSFLRVPAMVMWLLVAASLVGLAWSVVRTPVSSPLGESAPCDREDSHE
jgi:hypothetical protein